ncbi:hypothetical protein FH972_021247 [Carpinus fangiana]|uniref:Uncharacterized protein n=1 Tax=Carpinus fangiana TaxID=176857 RepID=A0A5N6KNS9_9ROSI|nr:hypothetical protein FH972_021247 [Carpinus fangiana]
MEPAPSGNEHPEQVSDTRCHVVPAGWMPDRASWEIVSMVYATAHETFACNKQISSAPCGWTFRDYASARPKSRRDHDSEQIPRLSAEKRRVYYGIGCARSLRLFLQGLLTHTETAVGRRLVALRAGFRGWIAIERRVASQAGPGSATARKMRKVDHHGLFAAAHVPTISSVRNEVRFEFTHEPPRVLDPERRLRVAFSFPEGWFRVCDTAGMLGAGWIERQRLGAGWMQWDSRHVRHMTPSSINYNCAASAMDYLSWTTNFTDP